MSLPKTKILIVGAGLSGLAAANRLMDAGCSVQILEARDRLGGRVWSDDSLGFPLDRGAAWIHGVESNPMVELAAQFQASHQLVDFSQMHILDRQGQRISHQDLQVFSDQFDEKLKLAKDAAAAAPKDLALSQALSLFIQPQNWPSLQQDLFKRKLNFFEGYVGAPYEKLSARHWDHELSLEGGNHIMTGTYRPIIQGLAQACDVKLNTVVEAIHEKADSVEVLTQQGKFVGDAVIVTVPLGVLKQNSIQFDPPLPASKQKAIGALGMGLLNAAVFKFPRVFWPPEAPAFFFSAFDSDSIAIFLNFYHFKQEPILLGYTGGEHGRKMEKLSDPAILSKTMSNLRQHFGQDIPDPDVFYFTRWVQDPYSLGSYSYLLVGSSAQDREALSQPASDRIFFAGEASNRDYPATTHGAYWSGLREAERIIKKCSLDGA